MTKIVVALYEQAEQAQRTAQQLATLGIAQHEISVLPGQGGASAVGLLGLAGACWGLLGDAPPGTHLIRKLAELGIPQDQAELYAQGVEHGLSLVVARVENDRAEQASQVMERQPIVDIEARAERWASQEGAPEQALQAIEEELHVGKRQTAADGFACIRASRSCQSRSASVCMRKRCTSSAGQSTGQ